MEEASDGQLVAAARDGDRAALDQLLRRHVDMIHAVCARIAGNPADAPSPAGGVVCVVLAVITLSLHDLAYSLALAFFYPLVLRGPAAWRSAREWRWPVVSSGVLAAFYLGWREYVQSSRALPALATPGSTTAPCREIDELARSFVALPDLPLLTGML